MGFASGSCPWGLGQGVSELEAGCGQQLGLRKLQQAFGGWATGAEQRSGLQKSEQRTTKGRLRVADGGSSGRCSSDSLATPAATPS
jgi:hypothetical protein